MSFGVRSMLAFWAGGAAIPSVAAAVVATTPFSGNSGLMMTQTSRYPKPAKFGRGFSKWRRKKR